MSSWTALDPNQFIPSAVTTGIETLANVTANLLSAIQALPAVPSLPSSPFDPKAATAALINTVLNTLQDLTTGGSIRVLVIPIMKTIPKHMSSVSPTLMVLQSMLEPTMEPTLEANAYSSIMTRSGGNASFYRAFAESLDDTADANRPQYHTTDAVTMAVILAGAPHFAPITIAASIFDQIARTPSSGSTASRMIPTPQNLSTHLVGSPTVPNVGIRLDWDAPQTAYTSPYFPGVLIKPKRYAVIRSTDPRAQSARTVLDFFPTQALAEGMVSGKNKVVAIGTSKSTAFFDSSKLDPGVAVYYCVAWETTITEPDGTVSVLAFDTVSNITKIEVSAPPPPQTGRSPNWAAIGIAVNAFPPIARTIQQLIEKTRVFTKGSTTAASRLTNAMKLSAGITSRLIASATDLLEDVQRLTTSLARPAPSIYVTQFSSSAGGNEYLLMELARRLEDHTDATRPPFDDSEYVCGVCFVAGAPRAADLAKTTAFFNTVLGPANAANPLLGLLASIDTVVTQAETAVFGPDMQPLPPGSVVNPLTGLLPVPVQPVTANNGTAVEVDDPQNPNAGDTNVKSPSDICGC